MNNPSRLPRLTNGPRTYGLCGDARVEDYLEHLTAPLVGIVPYPERHAFREEAHTHIEGLICEFQYQGQAPEEATESALREFGEPWKLGQAFLQEWSRGTPDSRPAERARKATWTAFGAFGVASMLTQLMLENSTFAPSAESLANAIGLPALLSPLIAGCFVGAVTPAQASRGIRNALCILILHSCAVGALMQPRREGLLLAAWQLLYWLPAGWACASGTAACLRYVRRQRFWQIAR